MEQRITKEFKIIGEQYLKKKGKQEKFKILSDWQMKYNETNEEVEIL